MDKKNIKFDDTEIEKHKFYQYKKSYFDKQYSINIRQTLNNINIK